MKNENEKYSRTLEECIEETKKELHLKNTCKRVVMIALEKWYSSKK